MLKPLSALAPGDWVVREPLMTNAFVGPPYKVVKLAGTRVYLERYRREDDGTFELTEETYCLQKTILHVFTTFEQAQAANAKSRELFEATQRAIRVLEADAKTAFAAYLASIPAAPSAAL